VKVAAVKALLEGPATASRSDQAAAYVIVIAASSGGIAAISRVISALPSQMRGAVIVAQHRSPMVKDMLSNILGLRTRLHVETAGHGQPIFANRVYVSRADLHLTITRDHRFHYVDGTRIKHTLSAADPLLSSAARAFGANVIAVVLTGRGKDCADGVRDVRALGGTIIAQDPVTADAPGMPQASIDTGAVHRVLPLEQIGLELRPMLAALDVHAGNGQAGR
jgi:two-component system chemotaxis response regulator CheB